MFICVTEVISCNNKPILYPDVVYRATKLSDVGYDVKINEYTSIIVSKEKVVEVKVN